MTEADWLTGADFAAHLQFVADRLSPRRRRLLAAGFCRAIAPLFDRANLADALAALDRYAEGLLPETDAEKARRRYRELAQESYERFRASVDHQDGRIDGDAFLRAELAWVLAFSFNYYPGGVEEIGTRAVAVAVFEAAGNGLTVADEMSRSAAAAAAHLAMRAVVWDVVGNPFRAGPFPAAWRTDTVVALARQMSATREFGAMPILADALQDAGCDREDVLSHCRDTTNAHVRGCWVLDGVLDL
jgi:hypothetical protein